LRVVRIRAKLRDGTDAIGAAVRWRCLRVRKARGRRNSCRLVVPDAAIVWPAGGAVVGIGKTRGI
jgi:hypothetical protein